jgi:hypothetical protein
MQEKHLSSVLIGSRCYAIQTHRIVYLPTFGETSPQFQKFLSTFMRLKPQLVVKLS